MHTGSGKMLPHKAICCFVSSQLEFGAETFCEFTDHALFDFKHCIFAQRGNPTCLK